MTLLERTEQTIREAALQGNQEMLRVFAKIVQQSHEVKSILRRKGYGWTGLDLVETAKLVQNY